MILLLVLLIVLTIGYIEFVYIGQDGSTSVNYEGSRAFRLIAEIQSVAAFRVSSDRLVAPSDYSSLPIGP